MSGPASLFLLAASVLARSSCLSEPVPYMTPVAKDSGIEIRRPLQYSNSWITSSSLLASLTVHTYMDRSSAKAAWFHWGVHLMPCVIPVASSSRRRALRNRSKRMGEITDPCIVPVSVVWGPNIPSQFVFSSTSCCRATRSSSTQTIFPGNKGAQGRSIGDSKNRRRRPVMEGQQHQGCHRHLSDNQV